MSFKDVCRSLFVGATGILFLASCAQNPSLRFDAAALDAGLQRQTIQGSGFNHVVYLKPGNGNKLHVYLDGDGTPWVRRVIPVSDPTPRSKLMLDLMLQDPAPAIYLGRPCYHGFSTTPPCEQRYWTNARYSQDVVSSMEVALRNYLAASAPDLYWFGYSGGGSLAMLLAGQFEESRVVVTVAGNLDISAWTKLHYYSPLIDSLNPAELPALPERVTQWHWAGSNDKNTPPELIARIKLNQPDARLEVMENYNHGCCWREHWPSILTALSESFKSETIRQ